MKYIALLRGINVGGNSMIKMSELKNNVEKCGFKNVRTYINSGNVIFESEEKNSEKIVVKLENDLSKTFNINMRIVIKTEEQLRSILSDVPEEWKKENNLRCYIAFIKDPLTTTDILKEVEIHEGLDFVKEGAGVLYMSTNLSGITKSGFSKLAAKKVYKNITIRNYSTTQKIFSLL